MDNKVENLVPVLDLSNNLLDPDQALACLTGQRPDPIVPIPNAKACNNLDEYLVKSTIGSQKKNIPTSNQNSNQQSEGASSSISHVTKGSPSRIQRKPFAVPLVRNFDRILKKSANEDKQGTSDRDTSTSAHNFGLVYKPRKKRSDIFTKTEQMDSSAGPLLLLKNRLEQTINVLIRRRRKVPYISRVIEYKGTLILFDKHMNLYLKDVTESFNYKSDDKTFKRARHRDNILIRGDNVIIIS